MPEPGWFDEIPDLEGRSVGDLVFIRELSRGGMAVIYEAYQQNLRRKVAVKLLPPSAERDEYKKRTFDREAEAVANLQHPNIVQIFSIGQFEGMSYFVMELIKGKTLHEILEHRRRRPARSQQVMMEEEACRILMPVLEALDYAHGQGIIHRDIKPANIMIDHTGRVFLTDFGVLKMTFEDEGRERVLAGTPAYMAPEQAEGTGVDHRADLYAAGLILLEMLTGTPPREGVDAAEILVRAQAPEDDREWHAPISPRMARIIWKAVRPEADQRYPSAAEMLADLREPPSPEPVATPDGRVAPRTASGGAADSHREIRSRYRVAVIAIAVLGALCVALAFGLAYVLARVKS